MSNDAVSSNQKKSWKGKCKRNFEIRVESFAESKKVSREFAKHWVSLCCLFDRFMCVCIGCVAFLSAAHVCFLLAK